MKALSLIDPWGTLLALKAKKIETRSWQTNHRGPVAIHVSLSKEYLELAKEEPFKEFLPESYKAPFGSIIAIGNLTKVEKITSQNTPAEPERSFGDYTPGRFAWHFEDMLYLPVDLGLEPIKISGNRLLWNIPDPTNSILEEALLKRLRQTASTLHFSKN